MEALLPSLQRVHTPKQTKTYRWLIAVTVSLASMLEVLDASIVNVAMPHMMGTFGATLEEIAWVSNAYVIANIIVLPVSGWLSNFVGRRNYFAMSILVFTFASVMCGSANSLAEMVSWRIVQGLAGGGLLTTAQATIFEIFSQREVGGAMGLFGVGVMTGPTLGPTLGGWLTDAWSWPWIFYINLPLGIIALVLALTVVPDSIYRRRVEQIDAAGLLLLALAVGCLQVMIERGQKLGWFDSTEVLAYFVVTSVAAVLFVWQELRHPHPIVGLRILRDLQFSSAMCFSLATGAAVYSTVFVFPFYAQRLLGLSAWDTGTIIFTGAVANACTHFTMGRAARNTQFDPRWYVLIGFIVFGVSMWMHTRFTLQSGWADFWPPRVLLGVGLGMTFIPLNQLAMSHLPGKDIANASGIYHLTRQLGGSLGIALSSVLLLHFEALNRVELLQHVTATSPFATNWLEQIQQTLIAQGSPENVAATQALILLDAKVSAQASMLAFTRVFGLAGLVVLPLLPLLLVMRHRIDQPLSSRS